MTNLILERSFDPPLVTAGVRSMVEESRWCMEMHHVAWHGSLLSADGRSMVCRFSGRDADSVRLALRQSGANIERLWIGTVHDAPHVGEANVLVERRFTEPVTLEEIQAMEDAKQWCLDTHQVAFVRTFFAHDRKRMICLYSGPDAEAVRAAQREAGMPVDRVWAFTRIGPEHLGS